MIEEHESAGHVDERWLVSYADFMTLLFALFVVLFAISTQSSDKASRAWASIATAAGARPQRGGMRPELGEAGRAAAPMPEAVRAKLNQTARELNQSLKQFSNPGVTVKLDHRGLVISLAAARFFASGDDTIASDQLPVLATVARRLDGMPNLIEFDGYTDSIPIHDDRFRDNWELSAARAANVLRYVVANTAIAPDHLTLAGYGPYGAVADNSTEESRALNRRVEIVVQPVAQQESKN